MDPRRAPGLRRLRRPATASSPAFDLHYVRRPAHASRRADTPRRADVPRSSDALRPSDAAWPAASCGRSPRSELPILILPGGPGLGSIVPFARLRARAARAGHDVIMIEHRGIGLSRQDIDGADLPLTAMRSAEVVADIAAVLDAEAVAEAVVVGSSYGTYLAQAFAAACPQRVASLVLDSPMTGAGSSTAAEAFAGSLLLEGQVPASLREIGSLPGCAVGGPGGAGAVEQDGTSSRVDPAADLPDTSRLAMKIRSLLTPGDVDSQLLGRCVRIAFEFGGPAVLDPLLNQLACGRAGMTAGLLERLNAEVSVSIPHMMEFDRVGEIALRELGYGYPGHGTIFDQSGDFATVGESFSPFDAQLAARAEAELQSGLGRLQVPVTVLSGNRDLRTPRTEAVRIAAHAPAGELVTIAGHGHSALDTHAGLLLAIAAAHAERRRVTARELNAAATGRRTGSGSHRLATILRATLAADRLSSRRQPRRR